jgi:hypothetical protein
MEPLDIALLFSAVVFALASRAAMKRFVVRRLGKANESLLEIDFWKASSGEGLTRCLLFIELLSWGATILLLAMLAARALQ